MASRNVGSARLPACEIARMLALRIDDLVRELLARGHREGRREWRCGSIAGEPGSSLGVHLTGPKAGIWKDFAGGQGGDALDLVAATRCNGDIGAAIRWALSWLGLENAEAAQPPRPASALTAKPAPEPERWKKPWRDACPITGTLAETYLAARGLHYSDARGEVLRYSPRRTRKDPLENFERRPALLALLQDVRTGEPHGIINVYLQGDGRDRIRDTKGKTNTGCARGTAVMLSLFEDTTLGLTVCEGPETGIALVMAELTPVWALGGAGNLASFPVLDGIECLTVAADTGDAGQKAAAAVCTRWREAGREAVAITPPRGDWADGRR